MAYIPYVHSDEADASLRSLFDRFADGQGRLDHILHIHSLDPPSLEHHFRMYAHLMRGPSPLSRVQREMIAVTVSAANACRY